MSVIENLGFLFIGAMILVASGIIAIAWIVSEQGRDYIKNDEEPKDAEDAAAGNTVLFDRSVSILISLGVALLSSSLTIAFFAGNAGLERLDDSGNYKIYMIICTVIGIVTIVCSSILLGVIDTEKEIDGKKTQADTAMIASIVISSVCTVVGLGVYFIDDIIAAINAGSEKAKAAIASKGVDSESAEAAEFGFEFEF